MLQMQVCKVGSNFFLPRLQAILLEKPVTLLRKQQEKGEDAATAASWQEGGASPRQKDPSARWRLPST
jgi:hypothetical protein